MKANILIFLAALIMCAGCSTHYDIILNNGTVITSHGKPHLDHDKGSYLYTNASGQPDAISRLRVREISPHSMRKQTNSQFISQ